MNEPVIRKRPLARVDLAARYPFIGQRSEEAAGRFLRDAEATFAELARNPGVGEPYETANPRLAGLRCSRVKRFGNYAIFYLPIPDGIEVSRVLHAASDLTKELADEH